MDFLKITFFHKQALQWKHQQKDFGLIQLNFVTNTGALARMLVPKLV
jgi:hypothetical protein